jgi:hypothetical protein
VPEINADQADWAYLTILARLLEFTATLGDRSAPAVCAVVRQAPLRLVVGLMQDQDHDRRYGVELPLFLTDGTTVNWSQAIDAIREVHLHRHEYLADDCADYRFHGAPVVIGDRAVEFGPHLKPVEDTLYANLRFIGGTLADLERQEGAVFGLEGFSYHTATALRIYLRYYREDAVFGIDLPVPPRTATTGPIGSSYTLVELSSLFCDGVPAQVAEHGFPADPYCDRIYDLRSWFSRD